MKFVASIMFAGMILFTPSLALAMGNMPAGTSEISLVGKTAYDATFPTALGQQRSLSQAREGKKAVLFFWATWCPHCHQEIVRMNKNLDAITAKGVKIVLVSIGETKEDVAAYLKRNAVVLDSFLDEDNALQGPYDLVGVPTLVFVDEKGIIREVRHDFPDDYERFFIAK